VDAEVIGAPPLPMISFFEKDPKIREAVKMTFFTETAKRGVLLHPNHCWFLSMAHTDKDVAVTLEKCRESMKVARKTIR
jgi:glutamate-1-semialdehyde aminotransferase